MSGRFGKKARKKPIEELALQHLTVHHRDKSGGVRARMNRTFGRQATNEAIRRMSETLQMCDPNYAPPL